MRRMLLIAFVILPIALVVPQAFGGTEVNIKSATVNSDTLTLKGVNFTVNGGVLTVILNGNLLNGCTVNPEEVTCDISDQTLDPGTTYTVSVSAGNAPGRNDKTYVYISDGSSGSCTDGAFTSCYSGDPTYIGIGECTSGTTTCQGGSWGNCQGETSPIDEICDDGLDNDCDGVIDNPLECGECVADTDCTGGSPPTCTTPSSCQGFRTEARCVNYSCEVVSVPDDSACDTTIGFACGNYANAYCSGGQDQSPTEPCVYSCISDAGCDPVAYCNDGSICAPKKGGGASCSANNECLSGNCVSVLGTCGPAL